MLRLADALGWDVVSTGRAWQVLKRPGFGGLTYTSTALLCCMARVATAPIRWQGEGMSPQEVRDLIRFNPPQIYNSKQERWYLDLSEQVVGGDEVTLYQVFFDPDREVT